MVGIARTVGGPAVSVSRAGHERGVEEREHVVEALVEGVAVERVAVEQAAEERGVGEVAEQRAVAGDQQLLGVLLAERAGVHLPAEVVDGEVEHRPQHGGEVDAEVAAAVDRLAAHEADVGRVVGEELEPGPQDELDLGPADLVGRRRRRRGG